MPINGTARKVRLTELRTNSCRWPLGQRWKVAEFFCGERTVAGCPYCQEDRQLAFTPARTMAPKATPKR